MSILRCFIGGVEYRMTDKYSIREQVGQSSTATVIVKVTDTEPPPISQQDLQITDSLATPIYSGIIQSVDTPFFSTGEEVLNYTVLVKSLDVIFDNRLVSEVFTIKTTSEIVGSLFDTYLAEEGLTKGTIGDFTRTYSKFVSSSLPLRQILDELGDAVGAAAKIDEAGVFSFTAADQFPELTPPTNLSKLRKKESGVKLKSVQRLTGANDLTSIQNQTDIWIASQLNYAVSYPISSISTITINLTPVGVGIRGVDEGDTSKTFLYRYGDNSITVNNNALVKPVATDSIVTSYFGFFSIEIESTNESLKTDLIALNGTSGKIESLQIDTSITNYQDGQDTTDALLEIKSEREEAIDCFYTCDGLDCAGLLVSWDLAYTNLNITGKYVIVERIIKDHGPDLIKITLKLKNKNFYSRYGTVLNKNDKQINDLTVRTEDTVFKNSAIGELLNAVDEFQVNHAGIIAFPAEAGGDQWGPVNMAGSGELNEFYPT